MTVLVVILALVTLVRTWQLESDPPHGAQWFEVAAWEAAAMTVAPLFDRWRAAGP